MQINNRNVVGVAYVAELSLAMVLVWFLMLWFCWFVIPRTPAESESVRNYSFMDVLVFRLQTILLHFKNHG